MRTRPVALVFGLAALLAWCFWPIAEARWAIRFDAQAARGTKAFLQAPVAPSPHRPPNIVVILADDLGKYDTSIYADSTVPTPNLERLAADGVRFSAGYVTSPVCSPSRAALMTGRYQQRFGFELLTHDRYPHNRPEWWAARLLFSSDGFETLASPTAPSSDDLQRQGIPPDEITLAELLRKQGYRTGIFGKWHLGFGASMLPAARGFQEQYGFYDAFSLYADRNAADIVNVGGANFIDRYQWWRGRSGGSAIRHNGELVEEKGYLTTRIAEEAARWIEASDDAPFFAYVPFNAPHAPLQAPRPYVERCAAVADPDRRVYCGMVAALDDAVGVVLAALTRRGVADDTLVFFLSDNGAASYMGLVDNAPLAGGKLTNFEGGVNVPFLLRWPARIAAATVYTEPVSALDVFATAAQAAGAALSPGRSVDGVDLVPFVRGERKGLPHEALFWRAAGHCAVRVGRHKLITDRRTGARALYDLETDPREQQNLAAADPELASQLERRLADWEAQLVPPRWPPAMEYHFTLGGLRFVFPL